MALLRITNLKKTYLVPKAFRKPVEVKAMRGVSLELGDSETLAVVGESGCGKSTLAKVLMKIEDATAGDVFIGGKNHREINSTDLPSYLQMIFQDPYSSINPRKKIFDIIAEPLKIRGDHSDKIKKAVETVVQLVGLRPELLFRYPHMLSGGQRQRIGIARALVTEPKVIVCDEPVSALDVSVQAQVLNLLLDLQQQKKVSYLFISHDLGVVRFLAHRVAVMYLGEIVELADRDSIFASPRHPYTQLLLRSTPTLGIHASGVAKGAESLEKTALQTDLPSPINPPSGCGFHTRCPFATELCRKQSPVLREVVSNRNKAWKSQVACHHAETIADIL